MSLYKHQTSQRKTFLSPQFIPTVRTIQSPKFDQRKADQQHLRRKYLYQQKLANYHQVNSILSAKIHQEMFSNNNNSQFPLQNHIVKKHQQKPKIISHTQSPLIPHSKTSKHQQSNLKLMRQTNHSLHNRKAQLTSYLSEINTGVSQLQCILEQVEETYKSLQQIQPQQFNGLWLMNDKFDQEENIMSQKHTKDTIDFDYDRTGSFKDLPFSNQSTPKTKINHVACEKAKAHTKIETIDLLENKFKQILQKITKRQMFELKIDSEISELNALQKQIDQIRQTNAEKLLKNSISHKNLLSSTSNSIEVCQNHRALSKVKSLGRILS